MAKKLSSTLESKSTKGNTNFNALTVDPLSSDSEADVPPPAVSQPTLTPSKKAAARRRAQLRKTELLKGQESANGTASESDRSLRSIGAPVPALPKILKAGLKQEKAQAEGSTVLEKKEEKKTNGEQAKKKEGRDVGAALDPKSLIDTEDTASQRDQQYQQEQQQQQQQKAVRVAESVSSSDAETQPSYSDEEEDDDEDDAETETLAAPNASTPTLLTPTSNSPVPFLSRRTGSPISPSLTPTEVSVPAYTGADHDPKKKLQAIIQRTVAGLLMVCTLVAIVCLGHVYVIVLVFICQAVVFSELSSLFDVGIHGTRVEEGAGGLNVKEREREVRRGRRREERDRWSRRISWYFFAATNYFLYGESLIYYFKHVLTLQASFLPATFSFAQHHRLISFGLYVIGFVSFVANLTRAQLRRQFGLFGWIHMSLLLVVVSSHFIVNSILEGLIWFWVPASLVIMNDIAAYVCGMLFGRHQLIKLSPKKTVEGFVGAFFVTIAFAVVWSTLFMRFDYMICPVQDLATNILSDFHCKPNNVFVWREFLLPAWAVSTLATITQHKFTSIPWNPFQLHSIVMAIFASLVAPFGGFFASGFKRAFNIKDFGASIPGHGGVTDRMDCQFLMGLFSYVYYASLIRETHVSVASILATVVAALSTEEQLQLVRDLSMILKQKGLNVVGL